MLVKQFRVGGDRNFGYLAADETSGSAFVVDPSYTPESIIRFAEENKFAIRYAFSTHDHFDHTNGNSSFAKLTGKAVLLLGNTEPESGLAVEDGARFDLGALEVEVLFTPGHTDTDICLFAGGAVFTGDILFVGKVGGTESEEDARTEYHSLHEKLMTLPGSTRVLPGHDYGLAPESTIEHELNTNPFLLQPDFESFLNLKNNWLEYKRKHGIP